MITTQEKQAISRQLRLEMQRAKRALRILKRTYPYLSPDQLIDRLFDRHTFRIIGDYVHIRDALKEVV